MSEGQVSSSMDMFDFFWIGKVYFSGSQDYSRSLEPKNLPIITDFFENDLLKVMSLSMDMCLSPQNMSAVIGILTGLRPRFHPDETSL